MVNMQSNFDKFTIETSIFAEQITVIKSDIESFNLKWNEKEQQEI